MLVHGSTVVGPAGTALGSHWDAPVLSFAVLGPLEVRRDGEPVDLGPRRHVELLCLLLVRPRTVVTAEALAHDLWDGRPPASAANTLQGYVARLRRALEPGRAAREPARVLVTHGLGYSLEVPDEAVDLAAFRSAVAGARTSGDPAAVRAALDLWRGAPLLDVADASWAAPVVQSLEEERLAAEELHAELVLATSNDSATADLVPRLQRQVAAHPLRERTSVLLMRALYLSGRQAEALAVARATRERLDEELGLDPGSELRETELAILRQDDAVLRPAAPADPSAPTAAAQSAVTADGDAGVPGRDAELATLLAAADRARAATTAAAFVTGEPGIGKTRLVEGLLARLGDFRVLTGRCSDLEGTPAYWPWRQVLSRLGTAVADAGESRFEQALALAARLREDAAGQPLAVVLDDLQWSDGPSLELLELVLAEVRDAPLLVVLTARGPTLDPRLTRLSAALARHPRAVRLELEPLDVAAIAAAVREVTGRPADREVTAAIRERSGGNPFLARELARLLDEDGRLRDGVPAAVRDVLRLRTSALPASARDLLAAGAVLGRDFSVRTAAAMLDRDDVVDDVEAALEAGLLVEPLPGRLRFAHALVHEAVRGDLSGPRSAALHARAARALTEREQAPPGVLAHHLLHAREPSGIDAALEAAEQDLGRLAAEPALVLLDHAAEVAGSLPVGDDARDRLALLRGLALARLGRLDESEQVLVATAEAADARGDLDVLARAALALAADGAVAGYWTMLAPVTGDPDRAVTWLRRALAAGDLDAATTVALRSALATQLAVSGRPDPALAERAVAEASSLDADHRTRALTARWATLWTPRHARERLDVARELTTLAGSHVQRRLAARHLLATALLEAGDLAASDAEFAALASAVDRHPDPDFVLLTLWWRAMRALMSGDLAGAEATAADLQGRIAGAGGQAAATALLSQGTVSGIVAWERGVLSHATDALDAQAYTRHPGMQVVRALAHAQRGARDAAHGILDDVLAHGALGDDAISVSPLVLAAEVLAVAGDGGQAAGLLTHLAAYADAVVVFAPGAVCMGAGTLYTGTVAALAGDLTRARADLTDAVARNAGLGAVPFTVRSLVRLAWVLDRTGDAAGAAAAREEAAALAATRGLPVAPFAP